MTAVEYLLINDEIGRCGIGGGLVEGLSMLPPSTSSQGRWRYRPHLQHACPYSWSTTCSFSVYDWDTLPIEWILPVACGSCKHFHLFIVEDRMTGLLGYRKEPVGRQTFFLDRVFSRIRIKTCRYNESLLEMTVPNPMFSADNMGLTLEWTSVVVYQGAFFLRKKVTFLDILTRHRVYRQF